MSGIVYKDESYLIIGVCMEVYNHLGYGFSEIVYKDAIELELAKSEIYFEREKEFTVSYKGRILKHKFYADFIIYDKIILEVKCVTDFANEHVSQVLNYLKVSETKLALLVNFAKDRLQYKRIIF